MGAFHPAMTPATGGGGGPVDELLLLGVEAGALEPLGALSPNAMWVVYAPAADHRLHAVLLGRH